MVKEDGRSSVLFIHRDYLGSILQIADASGHVIEENSFDAWGCRRNPSTHEVYAFGSEPRLLLGRGYTGHEHLSFFGIINMNARLYDPILGRFLSPDPYVQLPDNTQAFNRYSYCMNNPLCYVDENGEFIEWMPVIVGAIAGIYSGGVSANNGKLNPLDWSWNSSKTWNYMVFGGITGAVSGGVGGAIATSGIPMANTLSIMGSSFISSVGTWAYTGGQTPISINIGLFSYDFTNNAFGYWGKKGNKTFENWGYGLGILANLSDALIGFDIKKVDLVTEHEGPVGHSALIESGSRTGVARQVDPNGLISVGPNYSIDNRGSWHWIKGTNKWSTYSASSENIRWIQSLDVNYNTIARYANWLNKLEASKSLIYSLELSSCVTHTSLALNMSGVFNVGIHPYLLNAQMFLWNHGVRPWSFNQYLNK